MDIAFDNIYIVSDRNSSKETAVQQQCQGNEPIVSGENGRERASVPQKKFGLFLMSYTERLARQY